MKPLPRLLSAVAVAALLLAGPFAPARAADTAVTSTISSPTTYSLRSDTQVQDIRIAVPTGTTPSKVTGLLTFDNDHAGRVEVLTHNHIVATVAKDESVRELPLEFPVAADDVADDGYLLFSIRYLAAGDDDPARSCLESDQGTAQLVDVVVTVDGTEAAPDTLASFFGQAVTAVEIQVPDRPDADLQEAGLAAEAALAYRYGDSAQVALATPSESSRAPKPDTLTGRVVVLKPGQGDPHTTITSEGGIYTLTVEGEPSALPAAAAALGSSLLSLAETPTATDLTQTGSQGEALELTLDDLGQSAPTLQGLGHSEWSVSVNQTQFGTSVDRLTLHLVGKHSELPARLSAVLSYYWNDQLVDSQVLTSEDTDIDRTITIPATQLNFSNTLRVELDAVPSGASGTEGSGDASVSGGFACDGELSYLPVVASWDGKASTVSARVGQPFDPGFQRFPQVLGNVLTVAFGSDDVRDGALLDAAQIVRALQRLNHDQLKIELVAEDDLAASSAAGLLVDATPEQVNDLHAPLRMQEFRSIDQHNVDFGVGVNEPYAALQAFGHHGRDLLVLSSWSPDDAGVATGRQLQSTLADSVATSANGWYAMFGDLAVQQTPGKPFVLTDSNSIVPQPDKVDSLSSYAWWVLAFVGLVLLLIVAQQISRRRLRKRARVLVDAQQADGPAQDQDPSSE